MGSRIDTTEKGKLIATTRVYFFDASGAQIMIAIKYGHRLLSHLRVGRNWLVLGKDEESMSSP